MIRNITRTQFVKPNNLRRFSTARESGTIETHIIKEEKENGISVLKKINVVQTWNKMSPFQKKMLGGYAGVATLSFTFKTYNDGKNALLEERQKKFFTNKSITATTNDEEWTKIKEGCYKNMGSNFFSSMFFPFTTVADVMPFVVLSLNKQNHSKN